MAKSIMVSSKDRCFFADEHCGGAIEKHHIFQGANRRASEKYGLTVYLCHNHHNEPPYGVHFNKERDAALKAQAQRRAMHVHGWTEDEFRRRFRKSYIAEE